MPTTHFLQSIAETFYSRYGSEIVDFTFVFSNKRAGIFFQKIVTEIITQPIFSPETISINDCILSESQFKIIDRTSALLRLYRIYKILTNNDEDFDSFIYWGDVILSDFDEIDKNGIDASQLLTNIKDLKEIDTVFDHFTEEQLTVIRRFWRHFIPKPKRETEQEFISTWRILYSLYTQFRAELVADNFSTEGMALRTVIDQLKEDKEAQLFKNRYFVFIGFNALNYCEQAFFSEMQKRGRADFYWDYEFAPLFDKANIASTFHTKNTSKFPSKFEISAPTQQISDINFSLISTSSDVGQAKIVHNILETLHQTDNSNDSIKTAVVLPDEKLLTPLLYAIPKAYKKVNITMGFPVRHTPTYSLLETIFRLQKNIRLRGGEVHFHYKSILELLNHQYIRELYSTDVHEITREIHQNNLITLSATFLVRYNTPLFLTLFQYPKTPREFLQYLIQTLRTLHFAYLNIDEKKGRKRLESDFLLEYYKAINRLWDSVDDAPELQEVQLDTLMQIIRRMTNNITIPFEGAPIEGLQIMGVLETRVLDFENIIIPSFNEGVFPSKSPTNSMIPYHLKRAFGLPTYEYQDSVNAYNFYRLLARAKNVFFIFDSRTDGLKKGEKSRYYHQLTYHYGALIETKNVVYDISVERKKEIRIAKNREIQQALNAYYVGEGEEKRSFSASSINQYLKCPLSFYFKYIKQIKEPEQVTEQVDSSTFGTIFHATMEWLYQDFCEKEVTKNDIDELLDNEVLIESTIKKAFVAYYFKNRGNHILEGDLLLNNEVIKQYVKQSLRADKLRTPFHYVRAEYNLVKHFALDKNRKVAIRGIIDRIESDEENVYLIDYKTGRADQPPTAITDAFDTSKERPKHLLQVLIYGLLYEDEAFGKNIVPQVYYLKESYTKDFNETLIYRLKDGTPIQNYTIYQEEFEILLRKCLSELLDGETPFYQTSKEENCRYCFAKNICNK